MRILLTGATGLVGQLTGQELARGGHDIIVVSRNAKQAKESLTFPAVCVEWNNSSTWDFGPVDAVVHLAGEPVAAGLWTASRRKTIMDSRIDTTKRLTQFFQSSESWPGVWLNASAIGYYGDREDHLLDETADKGQGFLADVVSAWEGAMTVIPASCRVVRLRLGVVLSTQGGALAAMMPVFRSGLAGKLGSGKQWFSWIHIKDLIGVIKLALEDHRVSGVVNVVSPEPVQNKEFTTTLATAVKRPAFFAVPQFVLKLAGELSSMFLASQRVRPSKLQSLAYVFQFPTLRSALADLIDFEGEWGTHLLEREQWIPRSVSEVFSFFSDEKNLERLTPDLLKFRVLGKTTPQIEEGTLIDYKLKIRGVPARWRTKIIDWQPGKKFVDIQLKGPYRQWHHTHEFESLAGGTLVRDRVLYRLPLWPFSNIVLPFIARDVRQIFAYRRKIICKIFRAL